MFRKIIEYNFDLVVYTTFASWVFHNLAVRSAPTLLDNPLSRFLKVYILIQSPSFAVRSFFYYQRQKINRLSLYFKGNTQGTTATCYGAISELTPIYGLEFQIDLISMNNLFTILIKV